MKKDDPNRDKIYYLATHLREMYMTARGSGRERWDHIAEMAMEYMDAMIKQGVREAMAARDAEAKRVTS